jgi:outer membrane receptor protein involved in Fe transport
VKATPGLAARPRAHRALIFALAGISGSIFAPGARLNAETLAHPSAELDVIVVTARKREERSQDVPISIIALSGKELERSHSYLPAEFVQSIPNMQLQLVNRLSRDEDWATTRRAKDSRPAWASTSMASTSLARAC